ncbi:MAG: lysine biosynthesis protein LysW [Pirellulaceae bacterium]|nr:lysine biosynthesis protein LysW [Pirellulaceae bacterium]
MSSNPQASVKCVECEVDLSLPQDCVIGEVVPCGECGCEMEVASLQPVLLELAPEIEEDWGE